MFYLGMKAFHIICVVAWFAALFYLPRIFVYHAIAEEKNETASIERFKVMERKLYRMGHIGMGFAIVAGIVMLVYGGWAAFGSMGWLHTKLTLVFLLVVYYSYCGYLMRRFAKGMNKHSEKFYRWINEVPTLFLIMIVFLVVLKPF